MLTSVKMTAGPGLARLGSSSKNGLLRFGALALEGFWNPRPAEWFNIAWDAMGCVDPRTFGGQGRSTGVPFLRASRVRSHQGRSGVFWHITV